MKALNRLTTTLDPWTSWIHYTVRHGLAKGLRRQGGLGFLAPTSSDLSKEEAFLAKLNLKEAIVYDIGCYEGLYAMFFASKVGPQGQVVCFEPIPASRRRIEANTVANGFQHLVSIHSVAIGAALGDATFVLINGESRGQASGLPAIQRTYRTRGTTTTVTATVRPLDYYLGTLTPPTFIKIDVEGMELDVIIGATETLRQHHPDLFIEMHGATRDEAILSMRAIVSELQDLGYSVRHVETGATLDPDSTPLPGSLHLYATARGRS